jgi:hypothetical protein
MPTALPKVLKMLRYTADLRPRGDELDCVTFWIEQLEEGDEPWRVTSDLGCDTHHTLDELLFWNLIFDGEGRHISEAMRARILADFGQS